MSAPQFKIKLEASAIPKTKRSRLVRRLFRRAGKEAFIVGEEFEVTYTITNIGTEPFETPTRLLTITIQWPNGQGEVSPYSIEALKPGENETINARWEVLAPGFALFFARLEIGARYHRESGGIERVGYQTSLLYRDERNRIIENVSFFSVFGQTTEEFYEYWGMMFAAIGLLLVVLIDYLPPLFKWLWSLLQHYIGG